MHQASPTKDIGARNSMVSTFGEAPKYKQSTGGCEWDRLMMERNEMVTSGCYDEKDPVI
jgi:hypothetical protein